MRCEEWHLQLQSLVWKDDMQPDHDPGWRLSKLDKYALELTYMQHGTDVEVQVVIITAFGYVHVMELR